MRMKVSAGTRPVSEPESWLNCGEWPSNVNHRKLPLSVFQKRGKKPCNLEEHLTSKDDRSSVWCMG